ncbi:MAG: heavy metal-associated domain-containing protein [Patescibacteria group bacterium]|jgi:Cu+-exporting ATPase
MFGSKERPARGDTATLAITGMHCVSCSMAIDGDLEDLPGVAKAETDYAKARTTVQYDPGKVSMETIIAAIKKLGYDAAPQR